MTGQNESPATMEGPQLPDRTAKTGWWAVALVALVLAAFWPALKNGFIWDDDLLLTDNALIKAPDGLRYIWASTAPIDYFPLTYSTFWLEWRLWGMNATGYHFANILLHGINAVLLWRVLLRLKIPGAWLAAALFAVHPVNVASVAWIAERKNTLALFFFLLSALFYLRSESEEDAAKKKMTPLLCYWISVLAFALSLLSKTAGVTLPAMFLMLAWWRGGIRLRDIRRTLPFFGVAFVAGLVTIWFQYHRALEVDFPHQSLATRVALAGRAAWFYIGKAAWPVNLAVVYPAWHVNAHAVTAYLPGLLMAGLAGLLWFYRARLGRPLLFALGGFMLALFPVLGFLEVNYEQFSWVADHWQYFSLPFATGLALAGLYHFLPGGKKASLIGGALVGLCAVLSWRQAHVYNTENMWRDTVQKNPTCWVAYNNLGQEMVEHGNLEEALADFQNALRCRPGFRHATLGLASTYLRLNRLEDALGPLLAISRSNPRDSHNRFNLGTVYLQTDRPQLAIEQYTAALTLSPEPVLDRGVKSPEEQAQEKEELRALRGTIESQLGKALLLTGQKDAALTHFLAGLEIHPDSADTHYQVALLLDAKHDRTGMRQHLREVIRLKPDGIEALNNLAWELATDAQAVPEEKAEALRCASHAAELTRQQNAGILDTMAAACARNGQYEEAIKYAETARLLAAAKGDKAMAAEIQTRKEMYLHHRPCGD